MGHSNQNELKALLGLPTKVVSTLFQTEDIWLYNVNSDEGETVRASFTVSKKEGILLGAVWIPLKNEKYAHKDATLSHFKGHEFTEKKVSVIARHEYLDETDYTDSSKGVSFRTFPASDLVSSISFAAPLSEDRFPATE